MRELYFRQTLPVSIEEAWAFFSNPVNLKDITPSHMGFVVTSKHHGDKMFPGQIISYVIKPLLGIPMSWTTEITHVVERQYFVDEQRSGPYAMWHHRHQFTPVPGGVLMEDILHYKVPLGPLGKIVDQLIVHREVLGIFDYRRETLEKRFGKIV